MLPSLGICLTKLTCRQDLLDPVRGVRDRLARMLMGLAPERLIQLVLDTSLEPLTHPGQVIPVQLVPVLHPPRLVGTSRVQAGTSLQQGVATRPRLGATPLHKGPTPKARISTQVLVATSSRLQMPSLLHSMASHNSRGNQWAAQVVEISINAKATRAREATSSKGTSPAASRQEAMRRMGMEARNPVQVLTPITGRPRQGLPGEEEATREQTHREAPVPTEGGTNKDTNRTAPPPGSEITRPLPVAPGGTARTLRVGMEEGTSTMVVGSSRATMVEVGEEAAPRVTAPGSDSSDRCANSMLSNLLTSGHFMIRMVRHVS